MTKKIIAPAVSLFIICLAAALFLVLTNQATTDRINAITAAQAKESQAKVMDFASSFEEKETELGGKSYVYQIGRDDAGEIVGYVFTTTANGYGGQVKIMTGILPDGMIHKIELLDVSKETPGLGLNAQDESFYSQFTGKTFGMEITKGAPESNQIKAITGATITSKAVTKAANEALELFQTVVTGDLQEGSVA